MNLQNPQSRLPQYLQGHSKYPLRNITLTYKPTTALEKNIDNLLRQSGIRDEKDITTFEQLALNKVSIDEVRQRQAQLRAMRELMFRQEQKAKRIAKIKSKQYRRIHKREREREMERRVAEEENDDGMERQIKREAARAKERMTLRHRNTGDWAKKMLSRGQHDLETRQAISEQIRRGDDLQRKILGVDRDDESEDDSDSAAGLEDLIKDPDKWGEEDATQDFTEIRKGVMGMKFMQDAEERQMRLNSQQIEEMKMKASLTVESDSDEVPSAANPASPTTNPGRKSFTPGDKVSLIITILTKKMNQPDKDAQDNAAHDNRESDGSEEIMLRIVKNPFHLNKVMSL